MVTNEKKETEKKVASGEIQKTKEKFLMPLKPISNLDQSITLTLAALTSILKSKCLP